MLSSDFLDMLAKVWKKNDDDLVQLRSSQRLWVQNSARKPLDNRLAGKMQTTSADHAEQPWQNGQNDQNGGKMWEGSDEARCFKQKWTSKITQKVRCAICSSTDSTVFLHQHDRIWYLMRTHCISRSWPALRYNMIQQLNKYSRHGATKCWKMRKCLWLSNSVKF